MICIYILKFIIYIRHRAHSRQPVKPFHTGGSARFIENGYKKPMAGMPRHWSPIPQLFTNSLYENLCLINSPGFV